jgi:hypothetical protein
MAGLHLLNQLIEHLNTRVDSNMDMKQQVDEERPFNQFIINSEHQYDQIIYNLTFSCPTFKYETILLIVIARANFISFSVPSLNEQISGLHIKTCCYNATVDIVEPRDPYQNP